MKEDQEKEGSGSDEGDDSENSSSNSDSSQMADDKTNKMTYEQFQEDPFGFKAKKAREEFLKLNSIQEEDIDDTDEKGQCKD